MREWNLKAGDPLSLNLAADARLSLTDYQNDQIWELSLSGGEPPALALQTTYGLRARSFRMFPRFSEGDLTISDPSSFAVSPSIRYFYPNFIEVSFSPLKDIDVISEVWVPESQVIAGRMTFSNLGTTPRQVDLEWVAQLAPSGEGERMSTVEMGGGQVLAGRSVDLAPVVFLTNGPKGGTGSYPSLLLNIDLAPSESRQVTWTHAGLPECEASFEMARKTAARRWDAEKARIDLLNSGQFEIHTGNLDWDVAFALSQKVAYSLFLSPTSCLPYTSFVFSRQPDQGHSLRGNGSDYNHLWNGQTPFEAYYLARLILPAAPDLAKGLLLNFLSIQTENGWIDWKPGLAGQRSQLLATPLLSALAWEIYQATGDRIFLEKVFAGLLSFVSSWFAPEQDQDGDGIPEWSHVMQTGYEDSPLFAYWHTWSQGADITSAESPALCAFLYQECQSLIKMAKVLRKDEETGQLGVYAESLKAAVERSWDSKSAVYQYWDRDSHTSTRGKKLGERQGPGEILIQREFKQPARALIQVRTRGEASRRPNVAIHGFDTEGQERVEELGMDQFKWYLQAGYATGERVYSILERVEIQGLAQTDLISLESVNYQSLDYTQLLPLWAGIPGPAKARSLVEKTIVSPERFWKPYGLPSCPGENEGSSEPINQAYSIPWNTLVGEGLVAYGYRKEAADLVSRLMKAVIESLKHENAFRHYYHSESGQGMGERNILDGLAPLSLFLDVLGVRILSPERMVVSGLNPFPWPVTVKYRGLTVLRQMERTMIVFSGGQTVTISDSETHLVALD